MVFLDLEADRFKLVFQVMKELSNISDANLSRVESTRAEANAIYEGLSRIRNDLEGVELVRLEVDSDESLCSVILIGASVEYFGPLIRRDLLAKWAQILSGVLAYLGGEELYLRTGYEEREIRATIEELKAVQW